MRLHVRHVSGSRAGLEQTFDSAEPVRIGREPSNDIVFDPHQDIVVSGRHAEFSFDGAAWIIRDLGSANGTYVGSQRVSHHKLTSGDSVQFGRGGPRLEVTLDGAFAGAEELDGPMVDNPGTSVMSINDIVAGRKTHGGDIRQTRPPVSQGTVMMGPGEFAVRDPYSATPAAAIPPARPKSNALRIVLLGLLVLGFTGIFGFLVLRRTPQKTAATTTIAPDRQEVERLRAELQAREAKLAELEQQRTQTTDTQVVVAEDLEIQYKSAQQTIEDLRRELEQKNDALVAAENKPPERIIRYERVPVETPRPAPQPVADRSVTATAPPPVATPPAQTASAPLQSEEPPTPIAALPPVRETAPAAQPAPTRTPTNTRASLPPPPPVRQPTPSYTTSRSPTPATPPAVATLPLLPQLAPDERLVRNKEIKRRVSVSGIPSDVAFPGASPSFVNEVARTVAAGLTSTGRYIVDRSGLYNVQLQIKSFRSDVKKADTSRVASTAGSIGSLLGIPRVKSPASAKSISYDAALGVQVTIFDARGRQIASTSPSSALAGRDSSAKVESTQLSGAELTANETPLAGVVRQVAASAVEDTLRSLSNNPGEVVIKGVKNDLVTIEGGRNMDLAPDDAFDVMEGSTNLGRVRIESVQETSSTGRLISGTRELAGKRAQFAGTIVRTGDPTPAPLAADRYAVVRNKAEAKDGPGLAFKTTTTLAKGTRGKVLYSIGGWTRLQAGSSHHWIRTSAIDFE